MNALQARPQTLRQVNLSLLRSAIRDLGHATRGELVQRTQISVTTVRALLEELLQSGELELLGQDPSSGGRKAQRYRLNPHHCHSLAFCIAPGAVQWLLVNVRGEIVEQGSLPMGENQPTQTITGFLDRELHRWDIRSIGVGVPGIVEDGSYWLQDPATGQLDRIEIGTLLAQRYSLPVVLENDLNATAIGFDHCYRSSFAQTPAAPVSMALVYFEESCVSGGVILDGRVVRGFRNSAGELSLMLPQLEDKPMEALLGRQATDADYIQQVVQLLCWHCAILNPQYVALGGPAFRRNCLGDIANGLYSLLPHKLQAEVLYSGDSAHDYYSGMAKLTAERMFDVVQLSTQ